MLTTVTLNASVDKLYLVKKVALGSVMRVYSVKNSAGGKGLNVARIISLLGEEPFALGITGGKTGEYLEELLKRDEIQYDFAKSPNETRACVNVRDQSSGVQTEFLEAGEEVPSEVLSDFMEKYLKALSHSSVIVLSGSLPPGVPKDYYADLVEAAKNAGKKVIADTSGAALRCAAKALPTLIKPNLDEIQELSGREIRGISDAARAAKELFHLGVPIVAVSMGAEGVVVASEEGAYLGSPPKLQAINTVGCGDSLVAGFAVGLKRRKPLKEMIRLAVTAAAANALSEETGNFDPVDYMEILPKVKVEKLSL
jgi:tagatose 6-phosphate kinase